MKLKITREGGFAGQILQKQMDTGKLPPTLQASLDRFIHQDHLISPERNPLLRDGYLYTVEWSGKEKGEVQFDESNMPKALEPLIHLVLR